MQRPETSARQRQNTCGKVGGSESGAPGPAAARVRYVVSPSRPPPLAGQHAASALTGCAAHPPRRPSIGPVRRRHSAQRSRSAKPAATAAGGARTPPSRRRLARRPPGQRHRRSRAVRMARRRGPQRSVVGWLRQGAFAWHLKYRRRRPRPWRLERPPSPALRQRRGGPPPAGVAWYCGQRGRGPAGVKPAALPRSPPPRPGPRPPAPPRRAGAGSSAGQCGPGGPPWASGSYGAGGSAKTPSPRSAAAESCWWTG